MKLDDIIKNTPNYKDKRYLSSLEIRICLAEALEKALDGSLQVAKERIVICEDGFVSIDSLELYLKYTVSQREEKETISFRKEKGNPTAMVVYDRDFKISDSLNKGIAMWLERIGKKIDIERRGRKFVYKGYKGITKDYKRALTEGSLAAIERFTYDFIKGALDFDTIAKIRNEIKQAENNENMVAPEYAFICLENPYYEFFKNVIVYDASRDDVDRENPTRIVLKVVRERKAAISGKTLRPLARLMAEPLHHSMRAISKNNTIDEKYGYVEMYVSDYMYLKRILLPWGSDIIVESPAELRQLMQDEAKRMIEAYSQVPEEAEYTIVEVPNEEVENESETLKGMA